MSDPRSSRLSVLRAAGAAVLVAAALCGQSVTVTGTWSRVPVEEADRAVAVLPVDRNTLLLSSSWTDLLRQHPSLDVRERVPNGVLADLSVRGAGFGQTLVLLNGMRFNDAQTGHFNLNLPVPLEAIEQIEVLQGTGSLFHGSDALGGVVNFVTARPDTPSVRLQTAYGSHGSQQQRINLGWTKTLFSQRLLASREFSTGFMPNRDYRRLSLSSDSHIRTRLGNTAVLLAHADRPFGAERYYGDFPSWERTKTWWASARQELGPRTEAAFAFRRSADLFVLYRYQPERYTNRHSGASYQAAVRRRDPLGGVLSLHYGAEGYRDRLESTNLGSRLRDRGAAYLGLDARTLKRFSFTAGGREEVFTAGGRQFSPTIAAACWFSEHAKLRGGVSHGFRLPTFTDLYYRDPANIGNPALLPEHAWTYEAGLDWYAGSKLRGTAGAFHRRESNGIDYIRSSPAEQWRAANFNRLQFTGVEVGIAWLGRRHRIESRHTQLHGAQGALKGMQSKYVFSYPTANTVAVWQGGMPLGLIGRVRFARVGRIARAPYTVLDSTLARAGGRLTPFAHLTNLTNARYEEIPGVSVPGRAIVLGIEIRPWR